jgi:hypothetical protein
MFVNLLTSLTNVKLKKNVVWYLLYGHTQKRRFFFFSLKKNMTFNLIEKHFKTKYTLLLGNLYVYCIFLKLSLVFQLLEEYLSILH